MSSIHYFQRYSQAENVATNNTLLLFSRLYQHSPNKFKAFLSSLLNDTDLEAGILFNQQEKSSKSVPDGSISQTSFKVAIETKMNKNFNVNQLVNHIHSFANEDFKVLLSLSPGLPRQGTERKVNDQIKAHDPNIKFIITTFQDVVETIRTVVNDYEFELNEIIDDYENYCMTSNLITDDEFKMRVVTCGWTLAENFKFNLYYSKSEKGFSDHSYLGIYNDKRVRGIGKLTNIITADLKPNGELKIFNSTNPVTDEQKENIKNVIPEAKTNNNWDISYGHNFFCVDNFYETDFVKTSKYPLQGTKFFNLKKTLNLENLPNTLVISELLRKLTW